VVEGNRLAGLASRAAATVMQATPALWQALTTLPRRQRETVVLRYLEGLSEPETAAVLGCSTGTVKSQTARALHTLENLFQREDLRR